MKLLINIVKNIPFYEIYETITSITVRPSTLNKVFIIYIIIKSMIPYILLKSIFEYKGPIGFLMCIQAGINSNMENIEMLMKF